MGKCPDMCPEKERYMREDRRRLSWFELDQHTSEPGVRDELVMLSLFQGLVCVRAGSASGPPTSCEGIQPLSS